MRGEREYHLHKALTALRTRFVVAAEAAARSDTGDSERIRTSVRISRARSESKTDASRPGSRLDDSEGSETAAASDESGAEEEEAPPPRRWMPGEWRMHATEHLVALGRPTHNRRDARSAVEELRGGLLDLYTASPLSNHRRQADGLAGWTREVKSSRTVHDLNILLHTFARHLPRSCFRRTVHLEKAWWPIDEDKEEGHRERGKDKRGDEPLPRLESVRRPSSEKHARSSTQLRPWVCPSHAPRADGRRSPALTFSMRTPSTPLALVLTPSPQLPLVFFFSLPIALVLTRSSHLPLCPQAHQVLFRLHVLDSAIVFGKA